MRVCFWVAGLSAVALFVHQQWLTLMSGHVGPLEVAGFIISFVAIPFILFAAMVAWGLGIFIILNFVWLGLAAVIANALGLMNRSGRGMYWTVAFILAVVGFLADACRRFHLG